MFFARFAQIMFSLLYNHKEIYWGKCSHKFLSKSINTACYVFDRFSFVTMVSSSL